MMHVWKMTGCEVTKKEEGGTPVDDFYSTLRTSTSGSRRYRMVCFLSMSYTKMDEGQSISSSWRSSTVAARLLPLSVEDEDAAAS